MMEWLKQYTVDLPQGPTEWLVVAILGAVLLILLHSLYRRLTGGLYIAGGRSRKARLAVMDAAPVDNHRRLVLVRRDDVEHLVMIGGTGDMVIEQNIRIGAPAGRQRSILGDNGAPQAREAEPVDAAIAAEPLRAATPPAPAERRRPVPQPPKVMPMPERAPLRGRDWMRGAKAESAAPAPTVSQAPAAMTHETPPAVPANAIPAVSAVEVAPETAVAPAVEPFIAPEKLAAPEMPVIPQPSAVSAAPAVEAPALPAQPQGFTLRPFRRANDAPKSRIFGQPAPVEAPKPVAAAPAPETAKGNLEDEMERLLNELTGTNN